MCILNYPCFNFQHSCLAVLIRSLSVNLTLFRTNVPAPASHPQGCASSSLLHPPHSNISGNVGDDPHPKRLKVGFWVRVTKSCQGARIDGSDLTMIQVDLIEMDDYPADSYAISPTAFLFSSELQTVEPICKST